MEAEPSEALSPEIIKALIWHRLVLQVEAVLQHSAPATNLISEIWLVIAGQELQAQGSVCRFVRLSQPGHTVLNQPWLVRS